MTVLFIKDLIASTIPSLDSWSSYHYNGLTCYDVDLSITAEIDDEKLVYDYPYSSLPTPTVEPSHGPATKVY
jgi:hypothetical protein